MVASAPRRREPLQLLLVGRGGDDPGAGGLGKLQRKQRHAAGAEDQHRVAGLHLAARHQASPGGDAGAGQRCRLEMRIACRRPGEGLRRHAHIFAGKAVETVSRNVAPCVGCHVAAQPPGIEGADDAVAWPERIDIVADGDHLAGAVRQRHAPVGERHLALHREIVAHVERAGADPDQHLTRPRPGLILLDQVELVQPARRSQPDQLHCLSPTCGVLEWRWRAGLLPDRPAGNHAQPGRQMEGAHQQIHHRHAGEQGGIGAQARHAPSPV